MREAVNDRVILNTNLTREERGMYFFCLLLKADMYTGDALKTGLVLLRYFVYFMALTNHQSVLGQIKSIFVGYEIYVLVFCHIVFWTGVIWITAAFRWYYRHSETLNFSSDSDRGLINLMNRIKWIQHVLIPVLFFVTLQWIMQNYSRIWQSVLMAVLLLLELFLTNISLYLLIDTVPRDKLFALINSGQEIFFYTLNKLILAIGLLSDLNSFSFVKIYLKVALCIALGLVLLFCCFKVRYWSENANLMIMGLQLFLFVYSLVSFTETMGVHESSALLAASVCYPIALKSGINQIRSLKLSRTFDIKNKNIINPYASASMDSILRDTDRAGQKNTEYLLYYQGLILEMLKVPKEVCLMKPVEVNSIEDLDRVIVQNALKNRLDLDNLKLAFYFFLKFPYHSFAFCSIFVGRMKSLMDSRYSDKLQWFYFKLLLESKFEGAYFFKEADSSKSKDLCDLYRDISITSNKPPSQEYVNINYPLQCKKVYLIFLENLKNTTGRLKDQFNYLISCRMISRPVRIHKLYHFNVKLVSASAKVKASLTFLKENIPEPPRYYYPALYSYYAGVMYDPAKAREILQLFKSGINSWSLIKSKAKLIKPNTSSGNTVVLQMSTAKQNAGEITDATPNADSLFKVMPGDKQVIGRNCNELFVDFLKTKHMVFMSSMTSVDKIVNAKGGFFLKLFDKSLKEVEFMIKFAFHIEKYATMLVSLKTLSKMQNQFLVISSLTAEIFQAEKRFWRAIGKRRHVAKFNINAVSQRISKMAKMIKIMMELAQYENNESSSASLSPAFKAMLKKILGCNKSDSLCFTADNGSEIHKKYGSTKMLVRFEPGNFGKTFFIKLYFTFEIAHIAALETVAYSSPKNSTRQTLTKPVLENSISSEGSFQEHCDLADKFSMNHASHDADTQAFSTMASADTLIGELSDILAGINAGSIDLFVGDWKRKLSDLVKEVDLYRKLAAKDQARTGSPSNFKLSSSSPFSISKVGKQENAKPKTANFNLQKELKINQEIKEPSVISTKFLNRKTTNEHEVSASIQKKASALSNIKLLKTDSIRSDENRLNSQSLIKVAQDKKNVEEINLSYTRKTTEKAGLLKPQASLNQAIPERKHLHLHVRKC